MGVEATGLETPRDGTPFAKLHRVDGQCKILALVSRAGLVSREVDFVRSTTRFGGARVQARGSRGASISHAQESQGQGRARCQIDSEATTTVTLVGGSDH